MEFAAKNEEESKTLDNREREREKKRWGGEADTWLAWGYKIFQLTIEMTF